MRSLPRLASSLAVLTALSANATPAAAVEPDDTFTLGTVEIIGHREEAEAIATVDTVDAAELRARHRDDLSEGLDLIPGVDIVNTGQRRETTITMRGFTSRQVPLFIDGVPVYVPYDGNVDLSRFAVSYISQIVVSKGLASLLYGPNTLGGAVNVVSRKPVTPLEIDARVEQEADDQFDGTTSHIDGSIGGNNGTWYGIITGSYADSNGYRLPGDFAPVAAQPGGERLNAADRDTLVTAKIGYQIDGDEYALSYYRQDGEKHDPPYAGSYLKGPTVPDGVQVRYWNWPYWDKDSIYFVARNQIGSQGTLRWRVFNDTFRNSLDSYDDGTYTTHNRPYAFIGSNYNDYSYGASADLEWDWNTADITRLASHFKNDVHREYTEQPPSPLVHMSIPTYDVAIEHEWHALPGLTVTPGYSYMWQPERTVNVYNSGSQQYSPVETAHSSANNGQLVANYKFDDERNIYAGVSHKTRFPTIKERFSGGLGSVVPNPALDPETANHVEVGFEQHARLWSAKIALYQAKIENAIQSVALPVTACAVSPCTQLQNVGNQRNRGFEITAGYTPIQTLHFDAEWDLVQVENLNNEAIKYIGQPEDKYRLMGDWQFLPLWHLRADAQHESSRYSNSAGTRQTGSFTLVNAFLRFEPVQKVGIEVGVKNATNELYAYEEGFYEPGRTWLAQLDYQL